MCTTARRLSRLKNLSKTCNRPRSSSTDSDARSVDRLGDVWIRPVQSLWAPAMKLLHGIAKVFVLVMLAVLPTLVVADVPSAEPKQSGGEPESPGHPTNARPPDGRRENPSAGNGNLDEIKTKLRATDEEWLVIGPKISKVISARRVAEAGHATEVAIGPRFGFFGGPPPDFPGGRLPIFGDRPGDGPGRRSRQNDRGGPPGPGPFGKDAFDDPGPPRPTVMVRMTHLGSSVHPMAVRPMIAKGPGCCRLPENR